MNVAGFALTVAAILAATVSSLLLVHMDPAARNAAILGALLAAANALAAYFLGVWSQERSHRAFFGAVVGGMAVRMAVVLGAVVAAVLALHLPSVPLALSLLGHFTVFLALELVLLHRRTSRRP